MQMDLQTVIGAGKMKSVEKRFANRRRIMIQESSSRLPFRCSSFHGNRIPMSLSRLLSI